MPLLQGLKMTGPGQLLWERQGLPGTSLADGTLISGDCIVSIIAHGDEARLQDMQDAMLAKNSHAQIAHGPPCSAVL